VVATGSRLVFVAGQEPEDAEGRLVGPGDLAVQARQVFANLGRALTAAGAAPDEVARITIYVVDYNRDEHLPVIEEARVSLFGDHKPADSLIGVNRLSPGYPPDRGRGNRCHRRLTNAEAREGHAATADRRKGRSYEGDGARSATRSTLSSIALS
jgi:enamine deaminase RidA (YjgF/YER057c/UK114 family)